MSGRPATTQMSTEMMLSASMFSPATTPPTVGDTRTATRRLALVPRRRNDSVVWVEKGTGLLLITPTTTSLGTDLVKETKITTVGMQTATTIDPCLSLASAMVAMEGVRVMTRVVDALEMFASHSRRVDCEAAMPIVSNT